MNRSLRAPLLTLAAVCLPLVLLLSACGSDSPDDPKGSDKKTQTYRGEKLTCYSFGDGKNAGTYTCDFETFYEDHPELLLKTDVGKEDDVKWVKVYGKPIACVVPTGFLASDHEACDWQRFYAVNPDLSHGPR